MCRIVRITTFISFDICSKCDQIKCSRDSQLWRIFRGCGHSFHLECNLPDISACPICKDLLKSKAESLGKTTNEAVKNFKKKTCWRFNKQRRGDEWWRGKFTWRRGIRRLTPINKRRTSAWASCFQNCLVETCSATNQLSIDVVSHILIFINNRDRLWSR